MAENTEPTNETTKKKSRKPRQPVAGKWIVQEQSNDSTTPSWIDRHTCDGKREAEAWLHDNGVGGAVYRFATATAAVKATEKKHVELTPV